MKSKVKIVCVSYEHFLFAETLAMVMFIYYISLIFIHNPVLLFHSLILNINQIPKLS